MQMDESQIERGVSVSDVRSLFSYDAETGNLFWSVRRVGTPVNRPAGCKQPSGYVRLKISDKYFYAHRVAWAIHYGSWPLEQLDHINHDGLDNRIANLRPASQAENLKNKSRYKNNASGVTGVSFHAGKAKWVVNINIGGKQVEIGRFANKDDAIAARRDAEKSHGYHENHGALNLDGLPAHAF
jgi:hypothetical protein